ncbi:MAG: flagellar protein FliT [Gammaproteobacteria bacterium]|nr:flagellar protein FliT [Gammaproteobacteria bacterium]
MNNLNKLIELTTEVQALVEAGDWIAAAKLEASRRPLVEAFFDARPGSQDLAEAGDVFEKVIALDARMLDHIRGQRRIALSELRRETGAGEAAKAYLNHSLSVTAPEK